MLDEQVAVFARKVGVEAACRAFSVKARSWRHRRQRDEGRLVPRRRSEPTSRAPHPAALTDAEKAEIVKLLRKLSIGDCRMSTRFGWPNVYAVWMVGRLIQALTGTR
jgi:hypothetical protein